MCESTSETMNGYKCNSDIIKFHGLYNENWSIIRLYDCTSYLFFYVTLYNNELSIFVLYSL